MKRRRVHLKFKGESLKVGDIVLIYGKLLRFFFSSESYGILLKMKKTPTMIIQAATNWKKPLEGVSFAINC